MTQKNLPPGYVLGRDTDGTWWLEGPPHIAFASLDPGEAWMIGWCDYETAVEDALQAIDLYVDP